jgi:hypothetical protein
MATAAIIFDKGWIVFRDVISPGQFRQRLMRHVGRATARNGKLAERQVRREIRAGVPPTNAGLTHDLKGGSKPLTGTKGADLFNSVTSFSDVWHTAIVGVKRMAGENTNVASVVHDGRKIPVTPAMRGMFRMLAWASLQYREGKSVTVHLEGRALDLWNMSKSKRFYPLRPETQFIVIPPRPFMRYAFQEPSLRKECELNWRAAVTRALTKQKG